MAEYFDLIGKPFVYGGRGPEAYDCYGLVMEMARRNGDSFPDFGFACDHALVAAMMGASLPQWEVIPSAPGAVILIRIGRFVSHVAYQINRHQMIHAWEKSHGVSVVNIDEWQHRIVGFYQHVGT